MYAVAVYHNGMWKVRIRKGDFLQVTLKQRFASKKEAMNQQDKMNRILKGEKAI